MDTDVAFTTRDRERDRYIRAYLDLERLLFKLINMSLPNGQEIGDFAYRMSSLSRHQEKANAVAERYT